MSSPRLWPSLVGAACIPITSNHSVILIIPRTGDVQQEKKRKKKLKKKFQTIFQSELWEIRANKPNIWLLSDTRLLILGWYGLHQLALVHLPSIPWSRLSTQEGNVGLPTGSWSSLGRHMRLMEKEKKILSRNASDCAKMKDALVILRPIRTPRDKTLIVWFFKAQQTFLFLPLLLFSPLFSFWKENSVLVSLTWLFIFLIFFPRGSGVLAVDLWLLSQIDRWRWD